MERVTGIGGLFFKARDPDALGAWYSARLGVDTPPESYDVPSWQQQAGPTVFAAMSSDSAHFGDTGQAWAVNFRVADLEAMIRQLTEAGITVELDPVTYPNGRFASLHDPEGNPVQLWEPAGVDLEASPAD